MLDTTVMVAAIRSDVGASRQLVRQALSEQSARLLISVPLVIEYEAVMTRPEHLAASGLSAEEVLALIDGVIAVSEPVKLAFLWRPALPDADDDMVLETAVNGAADAIVTFNRNDFLAGVRAFGVPILTPHEVLANLEPPR